MALKSYTRVAPPIPDWKFGEPVDSTESGRQYLAGAQGGFQVFESTDENALDIFSLLLTGVTPRAIALISSRSEEGIDNLAPFSFFTIASIDPPLVTFSTVYNEPHMKDTARNVLATKNFVVNIPSAAWIHQGNAASMNSPHEVSEWGFSGLTKEESDTISAPRVKECAFSFECELYKSFQITKPSGEPSADVFYGRVRRIHLRRDMVTYSPNNRRPQVNTQRLNPVSRLGEIAYATIGEAFRIPVPKWAKEGEQAIRRSQMYAFDGERTSDEEMNTRHVMPAEIAKL